MYPQRMSKVEIFLLKKDVPAVLERLQERKILQVPLSQTIRDTRPQMSAAGSKARLDRLVALLLPFEPSSSGLSALLGKGPAPVVISKAAFPRDLERFLSEGEKETEPLSRSLQDVEEELNALREINERLRPLTGLDLILSRLLSLGYVKVKVGLTRRYQDLARLIVGAGGDIKGSLLDKREGLHAVRIVYPRSSANEIEDRLKGKLFSELALDLGRITSFANRNRLGDDCLSYPLHTLLAKLETAGQELRRKREGLEERAREMSKRLLHKALAYQEQVEMDLEMERTSHGLRSTRYTNLITGWVATERLGELDRLLTSTCNDLFHLSHRPPTDKEIEENQVPTKMKNGFLGKLFEPLALTYATPRYNEIDPSKWMAVPFIVIFGIMLGDVGYSSLLIAAGLFLTLKTPKRSSMYYIGWLVLLMGVSGTVSGILMGSVFGDLLSRLFYGDPTHPLYSLEIGSIKLPYDSIREPMLLFMLALVIGLVEVNLGFILQGVDRVKKGDVFGMVKGTVSWMFVEVGGIIFIGAILIKAWELTDTLTLIGSTSFLIGLVLLTLEAKAMVLFSIEGLIGDIISFTRILALGLSTFGLAMAFNIIAGILIDLSLLMLPIAVVLLLLLHLMNLLVQVFGAFVHTLRLQYVEFFGKFFEGGGNLFQPFGRERAYTVRDDRSIPKEGAVWDV